MNFIPLWCLHFTLCAVPVRWDVLGNTVTCSLNFIYIFGRYEQELSSFDKFHCRPLAPKVIKILSVFSDVKFVNGQTDTWDYPPARFRHFGQRMHKILLLIIILVLFATKHYLVLKGGSMAALAWKVWISEVHLSLLCGWERCLPWGKIYLTP
jgi:hypothetical protein